jgi:transcriptional regulator with XRE-family HTH domain
LRDRNNMAARELARRVSLSTKDIHQIENFKVGAKLDTLLRLAHALGVTGTELMRRIAYLCESDSSR